MWYILAFEQNIDAIIGPFDSESDAVKFRSNPTDLHPYASLDHIGGTIFEFNGKVPSHTIAPGSALNHIWGVDWQNAD